MVGTQGRSNYRFQLNADMSQINSIVQSYLQTNGFKLIENNGEQIYKEGNEFSGYRGFKYFINGQTLDIEAWIIGLRNTNYKLEQGPMNPYASRYRNSINVLFQELAKFNSNSSASTFSQNNSQTVQSNVNEVSQNFQNDVTKRQEQMCNIGFWLSIVGFLCSFLGVTYGVIIYVLNFYFASQGLKTRKKGKAIATIVLSIISILIVILYILGV